MEVRSPCGELQQASRIGASVSLYSCAHVCCVVLCVCVCEQEGEGVVVNGQLLPDRDGCHMAFPGLMPATDESPRFKVFENDCTHVVAHDDHVR